MARHSRRELDIEQPDLLASYLVEQGLVAPDTQLSIQRLAGGVSNRTVLVGRGEPPDWVFKQALGQLRVSVPWHCDPARAHREAEGLRWLATTCPRGSVPAFLFEDRDHNLLAMEAVPEPHRTLKEMLLAGQIDESLLASFGRLLGIIHLHGARPENARAFADRSYFEALRLEPYYTYTAVQEPSAASFLGELIDETRRTAVTVVHGDYSPKNVLVHNNRLVLLDHEVIHFGDPAFDIGFAFAHLLSKANHLADHRERLESGVLSAWAAYRTTLQTAPWAGAEESRAVRHTLGCLLARVAGRSPLEYLDAAERRRQRAATIKLMSGPPTNVGSLVAQFLEKIR